MAGLYGFFFVCFFFVFFFFLLFLFCSALLFSEEAS